MRQLPLSNFRKEREYSKKTNQPSSKFQLNEAKNQAIIVHQASTAVLVVEKLNENNNLCNPGMYREQEKGRQSPKLNHLKDKNARYESHKDF